MKNESENLSNLNNQWSNRPGTSDSARETKISKIIKEIKASRKGTLIIDEGLETNNIKNCESILELVDLNKHIKVIIINETGLETLKSNNNNNLTWCQYLAKQNIKFGINLFQMPEEFPDSNEFYTPGRDNLGNRLKLLSDNNCSIGRWRSTFVMDESRPSKMAIMHNVSCICQVVLMCLENDIVPWIEIDFQNIVHVDGNKTREVMNKILSNIYFQLNKMQISLEQIILAIPFVSMGQIKQTLNYETITETIDQTKRMLFYSVTPQAPIMFIPMLSSCRPQSSFNHNYYYWELYSAISQYQLPWSVHFVVTLNSLIYEHSQNNDPPNKEQIRRNFLFTLEKFTHNRH